jgi:ComF family protein
MWQALQQGIEALFYPPFCSMCKQGLGSSEAFVCTPCQLSLPETRFHVQKNHPMWYALNAQTEIQYATAWLYFGQKTEIRDFIHHIKYREGRRLAEWAGQTYGQTLSSVPHWTSADALIPVPMYWRKKYSRGYNQAEVFASGLSQSLGIPVWTDVIRKNRPTQSQTKQGRSSRMENVRDTLEILKPEQILGKTCIIVDDVMTTGATCIALGQRLNEAGAKAVLVCCLATAQRD